MIPGPEGGTDEEQGGDKAIATFVVVPGVGGEYSGVTVHVSHHRMPVKQESVLRQIHHTLGPKPDTLLDQCT